MSTGYRVIWRRSIIEVKIAQILADLISRRQDTGTIVAAMARIDQMLSQDPQSKGESRPDFQRVRIESPLPVTFEVHEKQRVVYILYAHYAPQRRPEA